LGRESSRVEVLEGDVSRLGGKIECCRHVKLHGKLVGGLEVEEGMYSLFSNGVDLY
jgi:hypothetical protein